jgi:hypothetical protein
VALTKTPEFDLQTFIAGPFLDCNDHFDIQESQLKQKILETPKV